VAANPRLRQVMAERAGERGVQVFFPEPRWCTDNAVMVAGLGWQHLAAGVRDGLGLDASPR